MKRKIAVIGGGASGIMAAIQAARAGAHVTVYERNDRIGKKILATGNGKCNFSNRIMNRECYYGSQACLFEQWIGRFGVDDTVAFFEELGMRIKERNGYLYPASEQASTVLDVLRYELEKQRVKIVTDAYIEQVFVQGEKVAVHNKGEKIPYDAVVIACGGKAAPKTGSDGNGFMLARRLGHKKQAEAVPALTALRCRGDFFKRVSGVRCDAKVTLWVDSQAVKSERGELQLTDYGISGIPVFQLSREAAYAVKDNRQVEASIDFMPDYDKRDYEEFWNRRKQQITEGDLERYLTGIVNKKLALAIIKECGLKPSDKIAGLEEKQHERIKACLKFFRIHVYETNGFEQSQVCAGGIWSDDLTENLQSCKQSGVYFAGEIIDIDGICGGYNLQWAWTSGYIAGKAAALGSR